MRMITIEVNEREAMALIEVATYLATRKHMLAEGISPWELAHRVMNEVAGQVEINLPLYPEEEQEVRAAMKSDPSLQQGVQLRQGMAMLSAPAAIQMMNTMAGGQGLFKDAPTISNLVKKLAQKLRVKPPAVKQGVPATGKPTDPTQTQMASTHKIYSPEELQNYPQRDWQNNPQGIDLPPEQDVAAQDQASMRGSGRSSTRVQDPRQQQRQPGMEDPTRWFKEAKRLLNRSPWGLLEGFGALGVGGQADDGGQEGTENV